MAYSSADPYPILWGLAIVRLHNFIELKKNNSMGSWLRVTVKGILRLNACKFLLSVQFPMAMKFIMQIVFLPVLVMIVHRFLYVANVCVRKVAGFSKQRLVSRG